LISGGAADVLVVAGRGSEGNASAGSAERRLDRVDGLQSATGFSGVAALDGQSREPASEFFDGLAP
jgi:hypothetical protein